MENDERTTIFRGGAPYSIDVHRLMEAFPPSALTEGRVITHDELAAIIQSPKGAQRYYSVVNSWIADMRADGIFLAWKSSVGVEVLDPAGVLTYADTKTQHKIRQTSKAMKLYDAVDRSRLNEAGQQAVDHKTRVLSVLGRAMQDARKALPITVPPIQSLPKRELPAPEKKEETNEQ